MGGTFVDCVLQRGGHVVAVAKAPTGTEPVTGIRDAIQAAGNQVGMGLPELLAATSEIVLGTTVGLNALLTRNDSGRVGLLTTRGHEDAILIGRVHQKVAGLGPHEVIRVSELRRPDPIVPRWLIHGIHERIDAEGSELVRLDESGVAIAADGLAAAGCRAVAICFLWSFREPRHEQRAADIVAAQHPDIRVCLSSDLAPILGEYERVSTTVVNAYLLDVVGPHLERVTHGLEADGFSGQVSVMTSAGGTVPLQQVATRPVETLGSGPVGGVIASQELLSTVGSTGALSADMGGTSFDVGLVTERGSLTTDVTVVAQLHLAVPAIDVRSIGAGGGSIAWIDDDGRLHVGPLAATPGIGPACYGRGGTDATVTDADLLLGRLDRAAVLGGRISLSVDKAESAIRPIADRLGIDTITAAAGIVRVADAQMADLLRRMSVERGHDPRELTLICFGGAGPLHVGAFAPDLGVREAIVPVNGGVFSADGLVRAGWRRVYRRSLLAAVPLEPSVIAAAVASMEAQARADVAAAARPGNAILRRSIDLRYRRQTHDVEVDLGDVIDEDSLADVVERFERRYEEIHGRGTGYREAGIEATTVRVYATLPSYDQINAGATPNAPASTSFEPTRQRDVYFDGWCRDVPIHDAETLASGSTLSGPALLEWRTTTLVVHPHQEVEILPGGHARLTFSRAGR
jgi:N-methylhydantoinase A